MSTTKKMIEDLNEAAAGKLKEHNLLKKAAKDLAKLSQDYDQVSKQLWDANAQLKRMTAERDQLRSVINNVRVGVALGVTQYKHNDD